MDSHMKPSSGHEDTRGSTLTPDTTSPNVTTVTPAHRPEMFRDRLLVSLVLTVPILYFSPQLQSWFGYAARLDR
jgi:hypothetical protein